MAVRSRRWDLRGGLGVDFRKFGLSGGPRARAHAAPSVRDEDVALPPPPPERARRRTSRRCQHGSARTGARSRCRCGFALVDAVLRTQVVDIGAHGGLEVHVGAAIGFEATLGLGPVRGRCEGGERHKAVAPAEAAIGFAPESEVEPCFGVGEQDRDDVEDGFRNLLSAHGGKAAADHEDHQRPEAEHDTQQGRDVTQQPEGKASAFHGRHYTCVRSPADLPNANPPYFSRKSLRLLEARKSGLLDKCGSHPTKWGVTLGPERGCHPGRAERRAASRFRDDRRGRCRRGLRCAQRLDPRLRGERVPRGTLPDLCAWLLGSGSRLCTRPE